MITQAGAGVAGAHEVRLGIAIPRLARPTAASLGWMLDLCRRLGISVVEVPVDTLEAVLGAPVPTVPLEPPADGLALGLLELEEDVLRDSYELAKQTFDAQVRAWRATASLSPLDSLRRASQNAGIAVDVVSVPDLVLWSDDEVDYACRATSAVGARVLATPASLAGPRRLAPFARRHEVLLSFIGDRTTGAAELDRLLARDDEVAVAIDLGAWTVGDHGAPVPFLIQHARRISHVRLRGNDDARMREVLRTMRGHGWDFPAMVVADPMPDNDNWAEDVTRTLAYCRASLE